MSKHPIYKARICWTGNRGSGTSAYRAYDRNWSMQLPGKAVVECSNDPILGGDPSKYNPEDLLLTALSSCHMLWYLHLCSNAGITVHTYEDEPEGTGELEASGKGRFVAACLKPKITISTGNDIEKAMALHDEIHQYCFIARSVNFPVIFEPQVTFASQD